LQLWSFSIFNTQNAKKYLNFYLATQIEHDESSYFCRALTIFAGALSHGDGAGLNTEADEKIFALILA